MTLKTRSVSPMLTAQSESFARHYDLGIWWSMNGREGTGLLEDEYFVVNFKTCLKHGLFDGNHDETLYGSIGFYLGMIHGGLLTPDFTLREDISTLVELQNHEFSVGYQIGRDWAFNEAESEELVKADVDFIRRLKEFVSDTMHSYVFLEGQDDLLYWYIGCRLGELSTLFFPQI
ncbi:MAG: hypothetical protein JO202_05720 [Ktedonobacteraceae bacterium]|nr:hypothetical protein [Ktedonobacteraceae bacterium]